VDRTEHWDQVHRSNAPDSVSWHEASPATSLQLVDACGLDSTDGIVDVGGGASTFVDELLNRGYSDVSVLDISHHALQVATDRLGERADGVTWEVADVTRWVPTRTYRLWHDRVVLHFLGTGEDREAYRRVLEQALEHGGWVILATFGLDGPRRCSGIDVTRYGDEELMEVLGDEFRLERSFTHIHTTPAGIDQQFQWVLAQRT